MKRLFIATITLNLLLTGIADGKCLVPPHSYQAKKQLMDETPIFVLAKLKKLEPKKYFNGDTVSIVMGIEKVLKGKVEESELSGTFIHSEGAESNTYFRQGEVRVFPIESINGKTAIVKVGNCMPDLSLKDFVGPKAKVKK